MIFVGNTNPVGAVVSAYLTEAQFQSQNGTGWILADGRSITGSALATIASISTAPDLRGLYVRGKNNGRSDGNEDPAGEIAIGTYQASHVQGHTHAWMYGEANTGVDDKTYDSGGGSKSVVPGGGGGVHNGVTFGSGTNTSFGHYTSGITSQTATSPNPGSGVGVPDANFTDTRPRSMVLNLFIRIN